MKPSEDDIQYLEENSRFTKREITEIYSDARSESCTRAQFDELLNKNSVCDGPDGSKIRDRLFASADKDASGMVSMRETVVMLSKLQRGTEEELCQTFFNIYDLDGDKKLQGEEITEVYQQLLSSTSRTTMTAEQKAKVRDVIKKGDKDGDGSLNFEEFVKAIQADRESRAQGMTCGSIMETIFLVVVTSLFEMGTSFSLPAAGALSLGIQNLHNVGTNAVANAAGIYYGGAMIGPLLFGILMDKVQSPIMIVTLANIVVVIGSGLQALAPSIGVLYVARAVLGFAGESTPFGTVESLQRLFPDHFLLMAGVRNLVQSSSTFAAFVLLPRIAAWTGDAPPAVLDEDGVEIVQDDSASPDGTRNALWFCFGLACMSLVANCVVWAYMRATGRGMASKDDAAIAKHIRAYSKAITPEPPTKLAALRMPPALIPAMLAIQAFYYPPFSFTAFTNDLFPSRFGTSKTEANYLSGAMSLIGGWLGPLFGPMSDYFGNRSITMSLFLLPSVLGFILYATTSTLTPWVGIVLMGITYGWGDTVSYSSIRLLVGVEKAGLGYGLFGLVGNIFGLTVPIIGGVIFDADNGEVNISWFFAVMCGIGSICWMFVRFMEGPKSAIELPARMLIETEDDDMNAAALYSMLGAGDAEKPEAMQASPNVQVGV